MTTEITIWEFLALRIAKRVAKDTKTKLTYESVKAVMEELKEFNCDYLVQIYFSLPLPDELTETRKTVNGLLKQSLNRRTHINRVK